MEQVEHFLTREEKDYDGKNINTVKIVGFFFDQEETAEDQLEFQYASLLLLKRTEIYFMMLTNKKEIKKAKEKYKELWFDDYTLTSVIIQRVPNKFTIIDISDLVLNKKKLSSVIEEYIFIILNINN